MRIVHVEDYYPEEARYQEYYLSACQAQAGHDVTVITSNRPPLSFRDKPWDKYARGQYRSTSGVRIIRLPVLVELSNTVPVIPGLLRVLGTLRPEVVHAHGLAYKISTPLAALAKHLMGFRIVIDIHEAYFNTRPKVGAAKRVYHAIHKRTLARLAISLADAVVAIGAPERQFAMSEFGIAPGSVRIIPLGADTDTFRPNEQARSRIRKLMGYSDDTVVLVHAGKIGRRKGLHLVHRALSILRTKDVAMLIVGAREDERYCVELEEAFAELGIRLDWAGFQTASGLSDHLCAADVGIWPEDPSISIVEAMACGLPLVLPEEEGLGRGYLAMENGVSFARGDIGSLASAIALLVERADIRKAMGTRSRTLAVSRFDWRLISAEFESLYHEILGT